MMSSRLGRYVAPRSVLRRVYLEQQAFVFFIGFGLILAGIGLMISPLHDVALTAWGVPKWLRIADHALYILAGLSLMGGIAMPDARAEAFGHLMFTAVFTVALLATFATAPDAWTAATSAALIVPWGTGSVVRAVLLISGLWGDE